MVLLICRIWIIWKNTNVESDAEPLMEFLLISWKTSPFRRYETLGDNIIIARLKGVWQGFWRCLWLCQGYCSWRRWTLSYGWTHAFICAANTHMSLHRSGTVFWYESRKILYESCCLRLLLLVDNLLSLYEAIPEFGRRWCCYPGTKCW